MGYPLKHDQLSGSDGELHESSSDFCFVAPGGVMLGSNSGYFEEKNLQSCIKVDDGLS
jgi:hypothetical protein